MHLVELPTVVHEAAEHDAQGIFRLLRKTGIRESLLALDEYRLLVFVVACAVPGVQIPRLLLDFTELV